MQCSGPLSDGRVARRGRSRCRSRSRSRRGGLSLPGRRAAAAQRSPARQAARLPARRQDAADPRHVALPLRAADAGALAGPARGEPRPRRRRGQHVPRVHARDARRRRRRLLRFSRETLRERLLLGAVRAARAGPDHALQRPRRDAALRGERRRPRRHGRGRHGDHADAADRAREPPGRRRRDEVRAPLREPHAGGHLAARRARRARGGAPRPLLRALRRRRDRRPRGRRRRRPRRRGAGRAVPAAGVGAAHAGPRLRPQGLRRAPLRRARGPAGPSAASSARWATTGSCPLANRCFLTRPWP